MDAFAHGNSGYINHTCRCDVCKGANRDYMREYMRRRAGFYDNREPKTCVRCEAEFWPRHRGSLYCGSECRREAERERVEARRFRPCVECGKSFQPEARGQTICSAACKSARLEARHQRRRLGRHGLTPDAFARMLAAQGGVCAACGGAFQAQGPTIDHCHSQGHVRGLLCTSCNVALGHVGDDVERLHRLIAYLERDNGEGPVSPLSAAAELSMHGAPG